MHAAMLNRLNFGHTNLTGSTVQNAGHVTRPECGTVMGRVPPDVRLAGRSCPQESSIWTRTPLCRTRIGRKLP